MSNNKMYFEVEVERVVVEDDDHNLRFRYDAWIGDCGGDGDTVAKAVADAVDTYLFDLALEK